jgi:hypothetical protein
MRAALVGPHALTMMRRFPVAGPGEGRGGGFMPASGRIIDSSFETRFRELGHGWTPVSEVYVQSLILQSTLTCPHCGHASVETMPTAACIYFHECAQCRVLLRPKPGDCCVFCSYGSIKCPPVQAERGCCSSAAPT